MGKTVVYFVKSAEYGTYFLVVSRCVDAAVNIANEGVPLYIECWRRATDCSLPLRCRAGGRGRTPLFPCGHFYPPRRALSYL